MIKQLKKSLILFILFSILSGCSNTPAKTEEPIIEPEPTYITFTGSDTFSLSTKNESITWDGCLFYSTDLEDWHIWEGTSITCGDDKKIYLRGLCNTTITAGTNSFVLTDTVSISCTGNLMNLLDFDKVQNNKKIKINEFCFKKLFYECYYNLIEAPDIITNELPDSCCSEMYAFCYNLTKPSKITADTLGRDCFSLMYSSCSTLETPPELPATNLNTYCYSQMFESCFALKETPKLPASKLASYCYSNMFGNCRALTKINTISASELADYCFNKMFQGCENLKVYESKPDGIDCYEWTCPNNPKNCTNCFEKMFYYTAGSFTDNPVPGTTYYIAK